MSFDIFLNFDGDCREAVAFYAEAFAVPMPEAIMTYGQNPAGGVSEADRDRILYTTLPVFGTNMMLSDCPSGSPYVKGTNVALTLGSDNAEEIRRLFAALSDGGEVYMPLGQTFFSSLYGMVRDRFEVTWQLSLTTGQEQQG